MAGEFNPNTTRTNPGTLAAYIRAPIVDSLQSVPGIGPATDTALSGVGIQTTYQLFGLFLSLRGEDVSSVELCERFYQWLKNKAGLKVSRGEITQAVAEKLNMMFPGCYNPDAYA